MLVTLKLKNKYTQTYVLDIMVRHLNHIVLYKKRYDIYKKKAMEIFTEIFTKK